MPADVQFRPTGGGVLPEREAAIRGPTQNEHLMASFEDPLAAADRVDLRSAMQAQREADEYGIQAEKALHREEAADKALMQRQWQLERLHADYEDEVQKLGQFKFDDKRYWKKQGAGDQIEQALLMLFGGLGQASGVGNIGFQYIMKEIDNDLEAQKFDYMVQQDKAKGAHNAFAMAMDRFGSEDAAAGVARAASIDATMQKINQVQAQWKGVDASNTADMLRAQLLSERERTIAAGIKFVPAQAVGGGYKMFVRGQEVPGVVSEKEAQRIALEHGVKPSERVDEEMVKGGIQSTIEHQKATAAARLKGGEKADEGARDIAHQMQTAGIPKMRALTSAALSAMAESEGGKGEAATRSLIGSLVPFVGESAANAMMSDSANAREQAFQAFANLNMNQLSGGAISPSEEGRLKKQLGTTSDPASRRRALMTVLTQLDAAETNIRAGNSPEASQKYDQASGKSPPGQTAKTLKFHDGK
jgi:hypothetical protein